MASVHTLPQSGRIKLYRAALYRRFTGLESNALANEPSPMLDDYLDCLEGLLFDEATPNISQIQEMLLELSCLIRSCTSFQAHDYADFLERLTSLYARGVAQGRINALTQTAADYADVIEAASRVYPNFDYSAALGQLLCYMGQLYNTRQGSWETIYDHISAMPESVAAVRYLNDTFFSEIRQWADEGVGNLFEIRRDNQQAADELGLAKQRLSARLRLLRQRRLAPRKTPQVIPLSEARTIREIQECEAELEQIESDLGEKQQLLELIDQNIDEFEAKLKGVRRNYAVKLVHSI
jgi:DNA repair exonuclease SbcCD ATPase subunit